MRRRVVAVAALLASAVAPAARSAEAPVLQPELARGQLVVTPVAPMPPVPKVVDGRVDDWVGAGSGFGGTIVRDRGELIYTDHVFDAYGADDGADAERLAVLDPLAAAIPETYRLDPVYQVDPLGQLGVPTDLLAADEAYGNLDHVDAADLVEVRLAASPPPPGASCRNLRRAAACARQLFVLARTTTMHPGAEPTIVVTVDGEQHVLRPGRSGVAYAADGWTNAVEAAIPVTSSRPSVSVVAGTGNPFVPANVAFRTGEPVRTWWDKQQALSLFAGDLTPFTIDVDLDALAGGATDAWALGPGYHDRIFRSTEAISTEGGHDGIWQHYGAYVPPGYDGSRPAPLTWWLHWRGGKAHSAAAVAPRVFRDFGDGRGGVVLAPRGRGTSTWWIGEGMADVLEVWADAERLFAIDPARVAVSGHSMGGNGSYVLSVLMPDRFAAALPVAGPVTQGAWTGLDFEGCDDFRYDDYTPCYVETNDGTARTQHHRRLLDNLRNTPIAIFQGAADELVPTSGVLRQAERLVELGYRHRLYLFPTYEHYSHPVVDEWAELARYADSFTRPSTPARVTFVRDMAFERRVEQGADARNASTLSFDFDDAWWMRDLTPVDLESGVATFDGRTSAVPEAGVLTVPEAGGPAALGQAGPYAMTGLAWVDDPLGAVTEPVDAFEITLTGAAAVTLDLARMGLAAGAPVTGTVTTDVALVLRLLAHDGTTSTFTVPPGTSEVALP